MHLPAYSTPTTVDTSLTMRETRSGSYWPPGQTLGRRIERRDSVRLVSKQYIPQGNEGWIVPVKMVF